MRRFDSETFVRLVKDEKTGNFIAQPTMEGTNLVVQYLNNKYQSNICCPIGSYSIGNVDDSEKSDYLKPTPHLVSVWSFNKIKSLVLEARAKPGDYRQAFILEGNTRHAVFMTYIKERDSEAILYSDSIGSDKEIATGISNAAGIKVYYTPPKRQADYASCYTDALVFGRDTTGVSPETGHYIIPDLIGLLEKRGNDVTKWISVVKLPNELLKTAQLSDFISSNKDHTKLQQKIHKNETVDALRERYGKDLSMPDGTTKRISTYLHAKGDKYKTNMEIQFYLNEIEMDLGHALPKDTKTDFIVNAKNVIESKEDLYHFSEQFLMEYPGFTNHSLPMAAPQNIKTKQENLSEAILANKYKLSQDEFLHDLSDLTTQFDKAFKRLSYSDNRMYSEAQEKVLSDLLDDSRGLAFTEYLLQSRPERFTGLLCIELMHRAITPPAKGANPYNKAYEKLPAGNHNPSLANLIIDNEIVINQLHKRHELYLFGQKDAYLAERLLNEYPHLLDEEEKKALHWVVDNHSSSFSDELLRIQSASVSNNASTPVAADEIPQVLDTVAKTLDFRSKIHDMKTTVDVTLDAILKNKGPG